MEQRRTEGPRERPAGQEPGPAEAQVRAQAQARGRAEGGRALPALELVEACEVWSAAPHAAFTDLIHAGDAFLLAFREGRGHVSCDGALRVLRSPDGVRWESVARLTLPGYDLRDADLSRQPDGRLLLLAGACPRGSDEARAPTGTAAAWSSDGRTWTQPRVVLEPGRWLWRVAWSDATAFGVSYSAGSGSERLDLLSSRDGRTWSLRARDIAPDRPSNETAIAFRGGPGPRAAEAVLLARAAGDGPAAVGLSAPPYERVDWRSLETPLGGPNLLAPTLGGAPGWIAAGRVRQDDDWRTAVFWLDVETGASTGRVLLPSGGDTSYPGLAWVAGELLVSYYSSHATDGDEGEPRTRVFVARLRPGR